MEWKRVEIRDENGEGFNLHKCEELVFPDEFMEQPDLTERFQKIKNLEYKDGKVLLCSYPKTGSHWIANIVHFLFSDRPVAETITFAPNLIELSTTETTDIATSRIITSHLFANRLPNSYFQEGGKVLIQVRNPKDTMVSMYYHLRKATSYSSKISWDYFFECFSKGEVPCGSFFDYYDSFEKILKECPGANVCVVHFEKLKKDGLNELKRIQKYLNVDHSEETLQEILDRLTVNNLREEVNSGKVKTVILDAEGKSALYRKGEIGDWRTHFTVAQNERFDRLIEERFKNSMFYLELY